jgi:hypothetical protein
LDALKDSFSFGESPAILFGSLTPIDDEGAFNTMANAAIEKIHTVFLNCGHNDGQLHIRRIMEWASQLIDPQFAGLLSFLVWLMLERLGRDSAIAYMMDNPAVERFLLQTYLVGSLMITKR